MKTNRSLLLAAALALGAFNSASAAVETYVIDPVHSSVGFSIRHFVSKVPGTFTKFAGTIAVDRANLERSRVEATIDVGSVNTANEKRDAHLKSPDFFDSARFTGIAFKSTAWKQTGDNTFAVTGDLTLHGVTKSVVLKVNLLGFGPGMQGAQLSGWEATTTLKKSDFGMGGPAMLSAALGDEVAITIAIEAAMKK
ncbi:MAG: YceI family protein [Verrucomicrobia bacterium]|nr:YceI family protein [Verrucomicrobiota bacterium]